MSEDKKLFDEVVAAIQKLLGFGTKDEVSGVVSQIVEADGNQDGILAALEGLFGKAIGKADLLSVVTDFLGKGKGVGLGNMLDLFQGIGTKVGGFDKIAGLVAGTAGQAAESAADEAAGAAEAAEATVGEAVVDEVAGAADAVVDGVKGAATSVTGAVAQAAGGAKHVASSVTGAVAGAAGEAAGAVKGAADTVADGAKQVAAEPAKKRKKWPIALGVAAAVIALAGVGMWIWHEQPSFCASFCHTSMDAYLETYSEPDNAPGVDKYGNDVANTHAMLAVSHASQGLTCLSCHIPAIDQQVGEVIETITGNYEVLERTNGNGYALHEVSLADLQVNAHLDNTSGKGDEFCLRSGCHDFTREVLTTATDSMAFNPHRAQHGEIACGDCHKSHRASVLYCTQCHTEAAEILPDGWLTFQEAQAITT